VAQWAVLRRRLPHAEWWIPAALIAWACGEFVGRILVRLGTSPVELLGLFLVPQLLLGVVLAYLLPARASAELHTATIQH
jgi:hypothetical protein